MAQRAVLAFERTIYSAITAGMLARWPVSIPALLINPFSVCSAQPILARVDGMAALAGLIFPSLTGSMRTARSRT